jgi:hypothetical protein
MNQDHAENDPDLAIATNWGSARAATKNCVQAPQL